MFQKLRDEPRVQVHLCTFYNCHASHKDIAVAGEEIVKFVYGAPITKNMSLDNFRFNCFKKRMNKKNFSLGIIPPTGDGTAQHFYRVYY